MMDEEFDDRPIPPRTVYKYVVPERVDVLANACIRFTPPLNTNDIFEVRQTFDLLAGPKMQELFREAAAETDYGAAVASVMKDLDLSVLPPSARQALVEMMHGSGMQAAVSSITGGLVENTVLPAMNDPAAIDSLLERVAGNLICLSLTERADSSPMWAHYAANSSGFVIAFHTSNPFFRRGESGERQGLQKITYFDGRISELMDDPYAALISKQADWAYEREWRLYVKTDMTDQILKAGEEDIHLVRFPRDAVQRVILGVRASETVEAQIRAILERDYPQVLLVRAKPDRSTATLSEVPT